jgi:hypothetical protein
LQFREYRVPRRNGYLRSSGGRDMAGIGWKELAVVIVVAIVIIGIVRLRGRAG